METTGKQSAKEAAIFFVQRFRIALLVLLVVVIAGIVFAIVWEEMGKERLITSTLLVEELETAYETLKSASDDASKETSRKAFDELNTKIDSNQKNTFVQQRSDFYRANIFFEAKDFVQAEAFYAKAAQDYPSSYLATVSLINAAFSAEQSGNKTKAVEYLTAITDKYSGKSPLVPRAFFNLARIAEEDQRWKEAESFYQKIVETFPTSNWTKLSRDRIIKLKAQQQL